MEKIKIIIVDDHEVIHSGIKDILKSQKNISIIGDAFDGLEAISMASELSPNVIFMDISMPGMNGIAATEKISVILPGIKIVALTQFEDNEYVLQFLKAGGSGYLLKNSRKKEFINAIQTVMDGGRYISYELSENLLNSVLDTKQATSMEKQIHLTRREIEIIQKIAEDRSNNEIADDLSISLRTVETHRRNIMQKLGAKSVVSLLKYAAKHNLIKL